MAIRIELHATGTDVVIGTTTITTSPTYLMELDITTPQEGAILVSEYLQGNLEGTIDGVVADIRTHINYFIDKELEIETPQKIVEEEHKDKHDIKILKAKGQEYVTKRKKYNTRRSKGQEIVFEETEALKVEYDTSQLTLAEVETIEDIEEGALIALSKGKFQTAKRKLLTAQLTIGTETQNVQDYIQSLVALIDTEGALLYDNWASFWV
jgi:hypothetical protein